MKYNQLFSELIIDKIGYLRLRSFNENSSNQLKKEISKLEKNTKLIGYIFDLRNNPGGLLSQAVKITDFFLEDGEIVSTKGRKIEKIENFLQKKETELKVSL